MRNADLVEDYNLWLRVSAAGWRIVTCPHILLHYTQGIGISANAEWLMRASLTNIDDLESGSGCRRRWRTASGSKFAPNSAGWRCWSATPGTARSLLRQIFRDEPDIGNGLHMTAGTLFAPALNLKHAREKRMKRVRMARVTLEDTQESEFAERQHSGRGNAVLA